MQASTWICTNQMHSIKFMSLPPLLVCFSCPRILILLYSSILLPLDPCPCLHSHLPYISLSKHFISLSLLPLVVCFSCPRILIVLYSSMLLPFWSMSMLVLSSPLYLFVQNISYLCPNLPLNTSWLAKIEKTLPYTFALSETIHIISNFFHGINSCTHSHGPTLHTNSLKKSLFHKYCH